MPATKSKNVPLLQVIRSSVTYQSKAQRLVQIIHQKSSQQFVHFVETLVAHEVYSDLGRKLLLQHGGDLDHTTDQKGNDEKYSK